MGNTYPPLPAPAPALGDAESESHGCCSRLCNSAGTGNVLPSQTYRIAEELQGNCFWLTATARPSGEHAFLAGPYLAPLPPLKESSAYVLQDCIPRGEPGLAADLQNYFIKTFSHHFCLKLLAISSTDLFYNVGLPRQINTGLCIIYSLQALSVLEVSDKVEQIITHLNTSSNQGILGSKQLILEDWGKKKVGKVAKKESFPKKRSLWTN